MSGISLASFDYSLKNIPIPSNDSHLKGVITQCELFLQRLRWKTYHFLRDLKSTGDKRDDRDNKVKNKIDKKNQDNTEYQDTNFGFKTPHNAPQPKELTSFENDLNHLISNLKYKNLPPNEFQRKLRRDAQHIRNSNNFFSS